MNNYEETIKLPSRGLLDERTPEEVTIRAITTQEEKFIYGSSAKNVFSRVIESCVVSPENFEVSNLVAQDETYLLIKLRTHTYGSDYNIQYKCPHCGETSNYLVDLDSLECNYLSDDFHEPIVAKLPTSGDVVSLRLLRGYDSKEIELDAKRMASKTRANVKELEYLYRLAKFVVAIEGEDGEMIDLTKSEARDYVSDLSSNDSGFIYWTIGSQTNLFGIDPIFNETCPSCGEDVEIPVVINSEFFRPKFG